MPSSSLRRPAAVARWFAALAGHWVVLILLSVISLAAFAKVGEDVFDHETGVFDAPIRDWVLAHQNPALWRVFLWITNSGSTAVMTVVAALVAAWLWWRTRRRRIAAVVITAPAIASALFVGVKDGFQRVRPVGALKLHILTYAFPSGHATGSTAVLVTVAYVLAREGLIPRPAAWVIGIGGPLLVGLSRVYLDVHWTTDVLGGWALGLVVATLSALAYEHLRERIARAGVGLTSAAEPIPASRTLR